MPHLLTRRTLLVSAAAAAALPLHAETNPAIHVVKGTGCECCSAWVDHLKAAGFSVTEEEMYGTILMRFKQDSGVPQKMISCHTGKIAGYVIEGHVPAADINRLMAEAPNAIGLSVPGMPYGSPGMGDESAREAYDVFMIKRDGTTEVFTAYSET
ncbi:DUF411 domain-containing protein [Cypionkella sp.]|uniref:DUF411 domain-containing protein n=1 Tax=Cypionkella sp. TaxID=2811411 RepID=UPI00272017B7|nr:DUF411 domain-containing protein [Cypionkella sp.]MDO8984418.1 DUF411 domain-containing protein [Cypionkella sp.]MDP1577078.1 DUF411 domain-containing protein [Cypionkella sp.]MDP2048103.1 DUF411 domain-containing protein [Cypionkella sp.]